MTITGTIPSNFLATEIKLRTRSRVLEVAFDDGQSYQLPFEYLRVHSPSAEVKGHGPGQEVLVLGKQEVGIRAVEPVGQYAIKLVFSDGHDSGLFTWKYLRELGENHAAYWAKYQARVQSAQSAGLVKKRRAGHQWQPALLQDPRSNSWAL